MKRSKRRLREKTNRPSPIGVRFVESYAARHTQPTRHAHKLSRYRSDNEVRKMHSGLIPTLGASSLVSIGAAYPDTVPTNLRICVCGPYSAGSIWEGETDARRLWSVKKNFFITSVLFLLA